MISAMKFESFCIDAAEQWMYAGDISGQISVVGIDEFTVVGRIQAHAGCIHAIKAHPTLPYIATLSSDRTVGVWRTAPDGGSPVEVCKIQLRDLRPSNDAYVVPWVQSISQALGFHDVRRRLVTRTANGGVVEIDFEDDGTTRVASCVRLHGNADVFSVRYAQGSDLVLSGSIDGELMVSREGEAIRRWQFGTSGIHWMEHVTGSVYLIASDMLYVARVDISGERDAHIGKSFTRDDLEHVTYNRASGRAFIASFDRRIYEIDPETCGLVRVAFQAPFKCRWIRVLERAPTIGLIQSRDGTLIKADIDTGAQLAMIRETPPALWTAAQADDGAILIVGEGRMMTRITMPGADPISRVATFAIDMLDLEIPAAGYTKRMAAQPGSGRVVLGRTSGEVYVLEDGKPRLLADLRSAVRDLAVVPDRPEVFCACESGNVIKLDLDTGDVLAAFTTGGQPVWALAHNPARGLLAVGARKGLLALLSDDDLSEVSVSEDSARPKRMKWLDADTLLFNATETVQVLDRATHTVTQRVAHVGNTIEDFIWDRKHGYLVLVSYTSNLILCQLDTGEVLHEVADQMDYSKGLIWLDPAHNPSGYPLDFITFGRSGAAHLFRIHDEKILALGPVPALAALARMR